MEPPRDAVTKLEEIHKDARLAWNGENETFSLLQVFPVRGMDEQLGEPWRDRGPVFGTPIDPVTQDLVWVADLEPPSIYDYSFLEIVRRWMTPIVDRMIEDEGRERRRREEKLREVATKSASYAHWYAQNKETGRPPILAKKFFTKAEKYSTSSECVAERLEKRPLLDRGLKRV